MVFRSFNYIISIGYNDFDHLLPVIDLLSTQEGIKQRIIFVGAALNCKKSKALAERFQYENVEYVWHHRNFLTRFISCAFQFLNYTILKKAFLPLISKVCYSYYPNLEALSFSTNENQTFIFAHGLKISEMAKTRKEKFPHDRFLLLPHGFKLCKNELVTLEMFKINKNRVTNDSLFDLEIHCDNKFELRDKHIRLPSLRFTNEWVNKKQSLDKKYDHPIQQENLKVAFIDPRDQVNSFRAEVWASTQMMLIMNNISIAFANRGTLPPKSMPKDISTHPNFHWVEPSYQTSAIIHWADVVIHLGTTLQADCINLDKIVIFPRYMTSNLTYVETYAAAYIATTRDDLYYFVQNLSNDFERTKKEYLESINDSYQKFKIDFYNHIGKNEKDLYQKLLIHGEYGTA